MFCAIIIQLLLQPYYQVAMVKSESCIRNQKYSINYSFMLSGSMAVTTVLACAQMILKFNGKVKSQL